MSSCLPYFKYNHFKQVYLISFKIEMQNIPQSYSFSYIVFSLQSVSQFTSSSEIIQIKHSETIYLTHEKTTLHCNQMVKLDYYCIAFSILAMLLVQASCKVKSSQAPITHPINLTQLYLCSITIPICNIDKLIWHIGLVNVIMAYFNVCIVLAVLIIL